MKLDELELVELYPNHPWSLATLNRRDAKIEVYKHISGRWYLIVEDHKKMESLRPFDRWNEDQLAAQCMLLHLLEKYPTC